MPFINQTPGFFNRASIEALNQGQVGVYGLYKPGHWIYVGQGDIRQRLLDHLNDDNPCITREQPMHWVAEVTLQRDAREIELIAELKPSCNQRLG